MKKRKKTRIAAPPPMSGMRPCFPLELRRARERAAQRRAVLGAVATPAMLAVVVVLLWVATR